MYVFNFFTVFHPSDFICCCCWFFCISFLFSSFYILFLPLLHSFRQIKYLIFFRPVVIHHFICATTEVFINLSTCMNSQLLYRNEENWKNWKAKRMKINSTNSRFLREFFFLFHNTCELRVGFSLRKIFLHPQFYHINNLHESTECTCVRTCAWHKNKQTRRKKKTKSMRYLAVFF